MSVVCKPPSPWHCVIAETCVPKQLSVSEKQSEKEKNTNMSFSIFILTGIRSWEKDGHSNYYCGEFCFFFCFFFLILVKYIQRKIYHEQHLIIFTEYCPLASYCTFTSCPLMCTHTHSLTHTYKHLHTLSHTASRTHTLTHTHAFACSHTHMHTPDLTLGVLMPN